MRRLALFALLCACNTKTPEPPHPPSAPPAPPVASAPSPPARPPFAASDIPRILPQLATDQQFVQMFLDEARIAARLSHPNIVQIFDLGQVDNDFYLAMEY